MARARKYRVNALCGRCRVAVVGIIVSDDDRLAGVTEVVEATRDGDGLAHVCEPCGEIVIAERRAEAEALTEAEAVAEGERLLAAMARVLGLDRDVLRERLRAVKDDEVKQ